VYLFDKLLLKNAALYGFTFGDLNPTTPKTIAKVITTKINMIPKESPHLVPLCFKSLVDALSVKYKSHPELNKTQKAKKKQQKPRQKNG